MCYLKFKNHIYKQHMYKISKDYRYKEINRSENIKIRNRIFKE